MAATAVPLPSEDPEESAQAGSEDVVLYFGIIDILQVRCHPVHSMLVDETDGLPVTSAACPALSEYSHHPDGRCLATPHHLSVLHLQEDFDRCEWYHCTSYTLEVTDGV